jgi:hypothetical protein
MSSQLAMSMMSTVEFLLSAALGFVFWKKGLHRRFPAMGSYLGLRVISTPLLNILLLGQMGQLHLSQEMQNSFVVAYFLMFYAVYIASAVLLFFICMEVFRSALSALPGLAKFGIVIFRWTVLASAIVTLSSMSFVHKGLMVITDIAYGLMRSVSILELCLLAFLCLSMNALHLSIRDMSFGIALGFGLMSANDFVASSLISHSASMTGPLQFVYQTLVLVVLATWVTYATLPEPVRKPLVVPVNSTIYRWNEIASALGHTGTQVAVQQPANSFFLTDVENVVDRVLSRNLKNRESES